MPPATFICRPVFGSALPSVRSVLAAVFVVGTLSQPVTNNGEEIMDRRLFIKGAAASAGSFTFGPGLFDGGRARAQAPTARFMAQGRTS